MFTSDGVPFACGKCPACALRRSNAWGFRLHMESLRCESVVWLRLSYDSFHLPIASNGRPTLRDRDLELFFKNIRNRYMEHRPSLGCVVRGKRWPPFRPQIKYFLCGEYGSLRGRPHYHVVLFNDTLNHYVEAWKAEDGLPRGEIYVDPRPFNTKATVYTCGYMLKPCSAGYGTDTRRRKFHHMSKRLGDNYLTDAQIRYHWDSPDRNFVCLPTGVKAALPRYYADKIFKPKSVNGIVCPVVRLAYSLFQEERDSLLDAGVRKLAKAEYDAHVRVFGSADDFIRSQAEARRAGILNFQKKASGRSDHEEGV